MIATKAAITLPPAKIWCFRLELMAGRADMAFCEGRRAAERVLRADVFFTAVALGEDCEGTDAVRLGDPPGGILKPPVGRFAKGSALGGVLNPPVGRPPKRSSLGLSFPFMIFPFRPFLCRGRFKCWQLPDFDPSSG